MIVPTFTKITLLIAGFVAVAVGLMLVFAPVQYYATGGSQIDAFVDLLSDLRGTGGSLLALGALALSGAFRPSLTRPAVIACSLFYLSYPAARCLAMVLDGLPSTSVFVVLLVEFFIGGACLVSATRRHRVTEAAAIDTSC